MTKKRTTATEGTEAQQTSPVTDILINGRRIDRPDNTIFLQVNDGGQMVFDRSAVVHLEFGLTADGPYVRDHLTDPNHERTDLPTGGAVAGLNSYSNWTPVPEKITIQTPNFHGVIDCKIEDGVLTPSWTILPKPEPPPPPPLPPVPPSPDTRLLRASGRIISRLGEIRDKGAHRQQSLHGAAIKGLEFWRQVAKGAIAIGQIPALDVQLGITGSLSFTWDARAPQEKFTVCFRGGELKSTYVLTRDGRVAAQSENGSVQAAITCFKSYASAKFSTTT